MRGMDYKKKYSSFENLDCYKSEVDFFGYQFDCLIKHFKDTEFKRKSCLDVGCGFGLKTYFLSKSFKDVLGVDFIENIINVNNLLNDRSNLEFQTFDLNSDEFLTKKFDCVTAFGLSLLNVKDSQIYLQQINKLLDLTFDNGSLIIWSFTDFGGKAQSGWYNHEKSEISQIVSELKGRYSQARIFYPHDKVFLNSIFTLSGLKNFVRFFQKRKYYFLIINK